MLRTHGTARRPRTRARRILPRVARLIHAAVQYSITAGPTGRSVHGSAPRDGRLGQLGFAHITEPDSRGSRGTTRKLSEPTRRRSRVTGFQARTPARPRSWDGFQQITATTPTERARARSSWPFRTLASFPSRPRWRSAIAAHGGERRGHRMIACLRPVRRRVKARRRAAGANRATSSHWRRRIAGSLGADGAARVDSRSAVFLFRPRHAPAPAQRRQGMDGRGRSSGPAR